MAPGQGTSKARGITKRWESHVSQSFCSLNLQSQSACNPSSFQSTPFLAWLCCIPGMPKRERQEAVGPKLMEREKPLKRGYLSCLYIRIKDRFMPQEGQVKQAGFLWEPYQERCQWVAWNSTGFLIWPYMNARSPFVLLHYCFFQVEEKGQVSVAPVHSTHPVTQDATLGTRRQVKKQVPSHLELHWSRTYENITLGGLNLVWIWASAAELWLNGNRGAESLLEDISYGNTGRISQIPAERELLKFLSRYPTTSTCIQVGGQRKRCCWEPSLLLHCLYEANKGKRIF